MIIVRSPLRISLGGGGTDLRSYYENYGGFVVSAAIDKYVYVALHQTFERELILKYSQMERVKSAEEVRHPIIRECLKLLKFSDLSLEITSMADIPAGTGMGSSASFTTALLQALHAYKRNLIDARELAEQACHIEIELLSESVGKQDQYIAAYGGLTCFDIQQNGFVEIKPLRISAESMHNLEDNLALFFTGYTRSAPTILKEQDHKSRGADKQMLANLHAIKDLGHKICSTLESGDVEQFGKLLHEHWLIKKSRMSSMSNAAIDEMYELGISNGALGGKLIGAGGGGFILFYARDKTKLRRAMTDAGIREVRFRFDFEGTKVIV